MSTVTWHRIVAGMMILFSLSAVAIMCLIYMIIAGPPQPFAYGDATAPGQYPRVLCPGDQLLFDLSVTVTKAPGLVMVIENWQRPAGGPPVPDYMPAYHVQERTKAIAARQAVTVPAQLPPGLWVYERAATVTTVERPALLTIPFTVSEGC